jgi:uncharacterized protein YbjT (DUF2867 family)
VILIVGATGRLGGAVARMLVAQGKPVRAMCRPAANADPLRALGVEVVAGDLRDAASVQAACRGANQVFAAAHAFLQRGTNTPRNVDELGNSRLIDAAEASGVGHFVFTSANDVRPDHPVDFFRHKFAAEEHLRRSGVSYTIVQPTVFMEFWAGLIGQPILEKGRAVIFGRGVNPINFVSADDVARLVVTMLDDAGPRNQTIRFGGPENLSLLQVAETFERVYGIKAKRSHVPLPVMKVMSVLLRPFNPTVSRQIATGVYMDTADMTLDARETLQRYPMQLKSLESVVREIFARAR